jgi:hypothetical protein
MAIPIHVKIFLKMLSLKYLFLTSQIVGLFRFKRIIIVLETCLNIKNNSHNCFKHTLIFEQSLISSSHVM